MFAAIFIVPIIYLINAYLIGRVIKRIKKSSDDFLNFVLGFFCFFVTLYLVNVPLYTFHAKLWVYGLTYGILLGLLIAVYIFNWKYLICLPEFTIKKLIILLIMIACVLCIGFACFRDFNSQFGEAWFGTIKETNFGWNYVIRFDLEKIVLNFSCLNISNIFWSNVFKISNQNEIINFCNWSWTIMASVICGSIVVWITKEANNYKRIILSCFVMLLLVTITLAFIESFAIPEAWLLLEILVYILALQSTKNINQYKLIFLTIILMSISATTTNASLIIICLYIYTIYWAVRNNADSISYLIFLGWPAIIAISNYIANQFNSFLFIVNMACGILTTIFTIFNVKKGTPAWQAKAAVSISKHSTFIIYFALVILIGAIIYGNLFILQEKYAWHFDKLDYKNFLTFDYKTIWNINISSNFATIVINSLLYSIYVCLLVSFIILRNIKKSKGYWITKDTSIKLGIVSIILFCNPLLIHFLKAGGANFQLGLNTLNLNMFLLIPFIAYGLQMIFNVDKNPINLWNYYWI